MSWSVSFIGKPEPLCKELESEQAKLTGDSRAEFDCALPLLQGLLRQNYAREGFVEPVLHLEASGSGNGLKNRSCQVSLKQFWTRLVQ